VAARAQDDTGATHAAIVREWFVEAIGTERPARFTADREAICTALDHHEKAGDAL
jgi:hypothetical protein